MKNHRPYIGVAGFMTSSEVIAAIETIPKKTTHSLAIGILASAKTFDGHTHNKPNRYPREGAIEKIVREVRGYIDVSGLPVEFILHYAIDPTKHIGSQLGQVASLVNEVEMDGIQINASPTIISSVDLLTSIAIARRNSERMKRVIVQIRPSRKNEPFVDMIGVAIDACTSSTPLHEGIVTDVLIDASAGQGIDLNGQTASTIIQGIRSGLLVERKPRVNRIGFGVAGGLRPGKLGVVHRLMQVHGPLSFDVETGVRDDSDCMNIDALRSYLQEAWSLVRSL